MTLGDFNPWFERRLARKYTPCLAGVVEALTPVLSCFATIRAQAEELGVAMLKEERSPTGVSASDASLPVVRQHVDNSIHLVDRIANSFPECPLDHEFLSGFVKHGRACLKQLSLNSVSLQQLADAPYNEPSTASRKVLKALTALKLSTIRSALEQLPHDLDAGLDAVTSRRFPKAERALRRRLTVELSPGDALYIPPFTVHHVTSLGAASSPLTLSLNVFSPSREIEVLDAMAALPLPFKEPWLSDAPLLRAAAARWLRVALGELGLSSAATGAFYEELLEGYGHPPSADADGERRAR